MDQISQKEYPPQRLEEENNQRNSEFMNEYNRYEVSPTSKAPKSESCLNKCTRWTLYLLPFIFFAVCFGLLIAVLSMRVEQKSGEVDSALRALNNFNENIQASPIYQIQVIDSNTVCPSDYEKKVLYTWPGVEFGCICSDGSVYTSTCFARSSCPDVSSVSSINTYLWENGTICVKTYTDPVFIVPGDDCPSGYWMAQSYLCLNITETLDPIVNMEILLLEVNEIPADDDDDQYLPFPEDYSGNSTINKSNISSSQVQVLHIERGNSLSPYVDLQVKISNPPCLDPTYEPVTSSGNSYPLLNVANVGCKYWGDSTTYVLNFTNETESQFNEENELDSVFDSVYDYDEYLSTKDYYELYGVKRISLGNSELCNTIDGTKLTSINESSEDLLNNVAAGAAIALTVSSLGLVLSICYIFCRGCRCGTKYFCQHKCLPITLYVMAFVVCIILFCLAGYYYEQETAINADILTSDYLTELIDGNCFTVNGYLLAAQSVETFLTESITTVGPLIVFLLAWAIIFVGLFLICWILRSCVKRLPLFI